MRVAMMVELVNARAQEGVKLVDGLIERGVKVHILNIGVMDNTPTSQLIRNGFFSFAEFERATILERTREGKAIAKAKPGFKEGRPKKYSRKQIVHALELLKTSSYTEVERMTGISKSTLTREARAMRDSKIIGAKNKP